MMGDLWLGLGLAASFLGVFGGLSLFVWVLSRVDRNK